MGLAFVFSLMLLFLHEGTAQWIVQKMIEIVKFDTDLVHLLDSSASVGSPGFDLAKSSAEDVNQILHSLRPIGLGGSRVALIKFGERLETHPSFYLGDFNTLDLNNLHVSLQIFDAGSRTATADGLLWANIVYQKSASTNQKLVWMYLDGISNIGGDPALPANWLKDMGVTICCIAIGPNVNMPKIVEIASPGCVRRMRSFREYKKATKLALEKVKKMIKKKGKKKGKAGHR